MDLTLIPFGLCLTDGLLVDVFDAERGKGSGYICPSCRTPLVARKGSIKRWHFAHVTRGTYKDTASQCDFSLYTSLRMMARQVIGNEVDVALPSCTGATRHPGAGRKRELGFVVSPAQTIRLLNVRVEDVAFGASVDIVGTIETYDFVLYLEHPGREVPANLMPPLMSNERGGVVSINLYGFAQKLDSIFASGTSYKNALEKFICCETASKRWIYHPKYNRVKADLDLKLTRTSTPQVAAAVEPSQLVEHGVPNFECIICRKTWSSTATASPDCPHCGANLCSRRVSQ
jgi:ssDNA-binding Zn-finger/Zn-ribbon topoisomerase 1